jgi:hypothetical protein
MNIKIFASHVKCFIVSNAFWLGATVGMKTFPTCFLNNELHFFCNTCRISANEADLFQKVGLTPKLLFSRTSGNDLK